MLYAVYDRGPISPTQRAQLASTSLSSWRVQLAQVGRILGPSRRGQSGSTIVRGYRNDHLPIPLDIRWRCQPWEWQGTSIECLPIRAYEVGAIPTHALSGNDRRKTGERRRRSNHSVTLNATKAHRESCFFLRRMRAGIGPQFVGFRVLDRPPLKTRICGVQLIVSSWARLGQRETFRTWREGPFTGVVHGLSMPRSEAEPKAPRVRCGTGLDGSWLTPVPSSRFGMVRRFLSPRSLLLTRCRFALRVVFGQFARLPYCVHSHQSRPLSRSYSIAKVVRSLPQEQWFGPQSTAAQTPNTAQTHTGQTHTRRQRPRFRIYAQPSTDQHVYAKSALQRPAGTH